MLWRLCATARRIHPQNTRPLMDKARHQGRHVSSPHSLRPRPRPRLPDNRHHPPASSSTSTLRPPTLMSRPHIGHLLFQIVVLFFLFYITRLRTSVASYAALITKDLVAAVPPTPVRHSHADYRDDFLSHLLFVFSSHYGCRRIPTITQCSHCCCYSCTLGNVLPLTQHIHLLKRLR